MAVVKNTVSCLAVAAMLITVANATSYIVGDADGWAVAIDYTAWLSGKTFMVGDDLVFNYLPNHDVVEVWKADYDSCIITSPIKKYSGESTTIPLDAAGKRYFICGTAGHCDQQQKLAVETLESSSSPPPPAATSPPPPEPETPPPSPPASPPPVATPPPSAQPPVATPPTAYTPETSPPTITPAYPPHSSLPPKTSTPDIAPTVSPPESDSPTSIPKTGAPPPTATKVTPTPQPSSAYTRSYSFIFGFALMMLAAI